MYNGARSGEVSFADYLPLIGNTANWTVDASDGTNLLPFNSTSFQTATALWVDDVSLDEGDGPGNTAFTFTVTRTGDLSGISFANFAVDTNAANAALTADTDDIDTMSLGGSGDFVLIQFW